MPSVPLIPLSLICMTIFASNSIFCRAALVYSDMGPFMYTGMRSVLAAVILAGLCAGRIIHPVDRNVSVWQAAWKGGSWIGGLSLFLYMFCFSLSYVNMPSAPGTLILNMMVQVCMLGWGILHGLNPNRRQTSGFVVATTGLVLLLLPGLTAPPLVGALLMAGSGFAWGVYSLCAHSVESAALVTAGNFFRAALFGLVTLVIGLIFESAPQALAWAFVLCGGLASSLGYILWYRIVPRHTLVGAAVIQLSVPVITAILGALFLAEVITMRLAVCSVLILGGIYVALKAKQQNG